MFLLKGLDADARNAAYLCAPFHRVEVNIVEMGELALRQRSVDARRLNDDWAPEDSGAWR
jgi:hypothetical protein